MGDSLPVTILFDLTTRDGRRAIEVLECQPLAIGYFVSPRGAIYSCAYDTQAGRCLALRRARIFCDEHARRVINFAQAEGKMAALF